MDRFVIKLKKSIMKTETIEDEIQENGNRKTVLGIRISPEQKKKLSQTALKLGITMSELSENILLNNDNLLSDKNNTLKENDELKRQVSELTKQLNNSNANHKTESENLKKCVAELQSHLNVVKAQVALHSDKKLLNLLSQLQGKKDTIETPEGQKFSVTYNTTNDLLTAMIYSFQLKK